MPTLTDQPSADIDTRRKACTSCDMHRGFTGDGDTRCVAGGRAVFSLTEDCCPLLKWPDQPRRATRPGRTASAGQPSTDRPLSRPDPTRFLTPARKQLLTARRAICDPCDLQRGFTALTVKCKRCGCPGLSLLHGR